MSNAGITLKEEAQYEVREDDGKFMVKQITKDSDVIEANRREEGQRVPTHNSRMKDVFMLIYFVFCLCDRKFD